MIERDYYIDSQGRSYPLTVSSGDRQVLSDEGSGLPIIEYITERGPFQHGETITDFFLRPRTVQFLVRQKFCSRQAAWDGRNALLDAIRPNKAGGPLGVLRKILPNREKRDLDVVPVQGPKFEPRQLNRWDEWAIQEVLRFTAYNPVYYNPVVKTAVIEAPVAQSFPYTFPFYFAIPQQLIFPCDFPISFYGWDYAVDINYLGTWEEYPTITVDGPAGPYIRITNETTGEHIALFDLYIATGDTLTITLGYGTQIITNSAGENLLRHVTADSDLATFHLEPGVNTLRMVLRSGGSANNVVISYRERFIGI